MALFETTAATSCLYSTVRNISCTEKFFGFLPPHGRRLASGEELTVWGDIQDRMHRMTPQERYRRSLEWCLTNDIIVIVNDPSVHVYDDVLDQTQIIGLTNDVLVLADPCWGDYSSSSEGLPCP